MKTKIMKYITALLPYGKLPKHMVRPGKMIIDGRNLSEKCQASGFVMLPIKDKHVYELQTLTRTANAPTHNDPFDRIMLSQAKAEKLLFITHDSLIPYYNEQCVYYVT